MRILLSIFILTIFLIGGLFATDDLNSTLMIPKKSYSVTLSILKNPITLVYNGDSSKLTDTITVIQKGRKNRVLQGPMSQYSKAKREEILKCVRL